MIFKLLLFFTTTPLLWSAEIWDELGIKKAEYFYLSAQSGLFCGFLFGFVVLYLVITK